MNMKPKISVLIPTYNSSDFIQETIDSVLKQTFQNFEIIITDDGSTDNTIDQIKTIKDPRITLYKFNQNRGISAALNNCIVKSQGEYIATVGSDDIFCKYKLSKQIDYLEKNSSIGASFTLAELIDDKGKPYHNYSHLYDSFIFQENKQRHEWLHFFFSHTNVLCASSLVIRKNCQDDIGLYDERLLQMQDFDMWIRLCMKYEINILQETLTKYRIRHNNGNISSHTLENQVRLKFEHKEILKNFLNIYSRTELNAIFPGVFKDTNDDVRIRTYLIARQALAVESNIHQLFGIELLYELLKDKNIKELLNKQFNFTINNLYQIAGRNDVFDLSNFHKITSSKFFQLWQILKHTEKIQDLSIVELLKKIKYGFFILISSVFNMLINTSFAIRLYKLTPLICSSEQRIQHWFYDTCIDPSIHDIQYYNLKSIKQHIKEKDLPYRCLYPSIKQKVYPPHYYGESKKEPITVSLPEIYVSTLKNVNIIGGNNIILSNTTALLEEISYFPFSRLDLRSHIVIQHSQKNLVIDCIKDATIIKRGIMFCGTASYNYYHWLIEFLPEYHLIEKLKLSKYPLLVDEEVLNTPQLKQSLDIINSLKLPVIPIKKNHKYLVQELVYPSQMSWTAINIRPYLNLKSTDSFTSVAALQYLQDKLNLKKITSKKRKIYIARNGSLNRRFNETEIINLLQKYNYEIVNPELLTFSDQVELFSQTKVIVAASGGGLTNLIFTPKGAKIICLMNTKVDFSSFSNLAEILEKEMIFLEGTIDKKDQTPYYYQKGLQVNIQKLEEILKRIELVD